MIDIPRDVEVVALELHRDGYRNAEAMPVEQWRRKGWRDDEKFFKMVDACLKFLRALELP